MEPLLHLIWYLVSLGGGVSVSDALTDANATKETIYMVTLYQLSFIVCLMIETLLSQWRMIKMHDADFEYKVKNFLLTLVMEQIHMYKK